MKSTGVNVKQFVHESYTRHKRPRKKKLSLIDEIQLSEHKLEFLTDAQAPDYKIACALKYQYFLDKTYVYFVKLSYKDDSAYVGAVHVFYEDKLMKYIAEAVWANQKSNKHIKPGDVLLKTVTPFVMREAMKEIKNAA